MGIATSEWTLFPDNKEHILFYYRQETPWFSGMTTKMQMLVGYPKSVLNEFNTSDYFYSLSNKECHESNSNKQKQLKNEGEAIAFCQSQFLLLLVAIMF